MSNKSFVVHSQILSVLKPNQGTQTCPYFILPVREQQIYTVMDGVTDGGARASCCDDVEGDAVER